MSINELDTKVDTLRELRDLESEIKAEITAEITAIEDEIKAEMAAQNTDVLAGKTCLVTWKTAVTNRFDSAAFKLTHADLFAQYSRATTSRRFVIA
nr:hypothetical protein [uncultured Oscillibacter sp.]